MKLINQVLLKAYPVINSAQLIWLITKAAARIVSHVLQSSISSTVSRGMYCSSNPSMKAGKYFAPAPESFTWNRPSLLYTITSLYLHWYARSSRLSSFSTDKLLVHAGLTGEPRTAPHT